MKQAYPSRSFERCTFSSSAASYADCPTDEGREVAFAGRSNTGKSSAINALTRNSKLARISKTPGRTQLFNFFELDRECRLVDLPGYGYARVPASIKLRWQQQIDQYLRKRRSLAGLILVSDIRHPLNEFDRTMLDWASACELPLHLLLTKADKLKAAPRRRQLAEVRARLLEQHETVTLQTFSATQREGVDELAATLLRWLDRLP